MKFFGHLRTINHHKFLVMKYCFKVGLYKQGLLHDLSKYSFAEFLPGIRNYTGNRSPNEGERTKYGYSSAWLHHQGRNKHHFEYWIDYSMGVSGRQCIEMPKKYVAEMVCDRIAASKTYNKGNYNDSMPLEYFMRAKNSYEIHENTKILLEHILIMLRDKGEEQTFDYVKRVLLSKSKIQKQ